MLVRLCVVTAERIMSVFIYIYIRTKWNMSSDIVWNGCGTAFTLNNAHQSPAVIQAEEV